MLSTPPPPAAPATQPADRVTANLTQRQHQQQQQVPWWYVAGPGALLLGGGTYLGYRRTLQQEAELAQEAMHARSGRRPGGVAMSELPFSPTRHAARALVYGTALACAGCGLGVAAIGVALGVRNVNEFAEVMRKWTPNTLRRLGWQPPAVQQAEAQRLEGLTFDEELEHWSKVLAAEEQAAQQSGSSGSSPQ